MYNDNSYSIRFVALNGIFSSRFFAIESVTKSVNYYIFFTKLLAYINGCKNEKFSFEMAFL